MIVFPRYSHLLRLSLTALTASTLTITGWISFATLDICGSAALASTREFGQDARHGRNGRAGRDGRDGSNQTVRANGDPARIDLSGTDGEDGNYGENAEWVRCRRQPRNKRHNLQAADGGNGGHGGNGGRGGNGGTLRVHYADVSNLRQILVTADGGRGGRGGRGGDGTYGCECDDHRWTVEVCNDGTCKEENYRCYDGRDGVDGRHGADGTSGSLGRLVVINQLESLPTANPNQTHTVASLANKTVSLSRNLWETRSGATSLLAPGSTIANEYEAYLGSIDRQFTLDWQAPQPAQSFTESVDLTLQSNGQVDIDFPEAYWLLGETIGDETLTTYRVDGIVPVEEVTQLAMGRVDGRSRTFEVNVVDLAQQSDVLETRFEVRYSTSRNDGRRRRYDVAFEGPIPEELVQQDHNRFTLALGRLPIRSQLLSGGTQAEVELKIIRSYGSNSAEQTVTWQGQI
ncbi:MAG: collagen-like protein [Cyanobacteria bacterium P01_H01_bin.21]